MELSKRMNKVIVEVILDKIIIININNENNELILFPKIKLYASFLADLKDSLMD